MKRCNYAKINLALNVTNKNKPNNFHDLDMINFCVNLKDTVTIKFLEDSNDKIDIICNNSAVPTDNSNIVYTIIIDKVLVGGKKSIFVQIISKENDKINEFIQKELDRGSTYFNVQGGYKGDEHRLLEVIVYRREYSQLIDYIHKVDKNAFVISLESKEVFGEGFKQYDKESIK